MIDSLPTPFFYSEPLVTLGVEVENDPNHIGYETGSGLLNEQVYSYPYPYPEDSQVDQVDQSGNQGQGLEEGYLVDQYRFLGGDFDPPLTAYDHHQHQHQSHQDRDQIQNQTPEIDTLLHQFDSYTPAQFPQTEYPLSNAHTFDFNTPTPTNPYPELQAQSFIPGPSLSSDLDIDLDSDTKSQTQAQAQIQAQALNVLQIDQVEISPTGLWTPITASFSLPVLLHSQDSDFVYDYRPESLSLQYIPQGPQNLGYQDLTPTLAPHYPQSDSGLEVDLDHEMTRDLYPSSPFRENGSQGYRE